MRKLLILLAFVLTFALVAGALAENEATEVEALDGEIAAENVDATPGETDAALSEEIEADLTPDAEEEPPEETSGEVRVEKDAEEEEESAEEESAEEESAEEESSDEESSEDAPVVEDAETPAEAETAEAEALMDLLTDEAAAPIAVEGLVYTGEPQALVIGPTDGTVHYSLDGENFAQEIPTGINAGEYTVFYKMTAPAEPAQEATEDAGEEADEAAAEEEAQEAVEDAATETVVILTVTIAKADVVFTPLVAITETV